MAQSSALTRWGERFLSLPESTREYVVLENDDTTYTVMDLLPICEQFNVPLCIDFFHHECNGRESFALTPTILARVAATWTRRGIKPKLHWSNQAEGMRKGAHADCVESIPAEILAFAEEYGADIMIEAKKKEQFDRHVTASGQVYWARRGQ